VTYEVYSGNIDKRTRDATVRGLKLVSLANQRRLRVKNGAVKTASQLAQELGVTEARVRQIRKELL
jgi:predicted transcriptional regulator